MAVQVAEDVVTSCVYFYSLGGKFDGSDQFEFAKLIVVLDEIVLFGEDELVEHLFPFAVESSERFQGGGLCHWLI